MLLQVEKELDDFFGALTGATSPTTKPRSRKALSFADEDENNVYLEYDVPGYKKEEIKIIQENGSIKIEGESDKRGKFIANFTVPKEVLPDNIDAKLQEGILMLTLPKSRSPTQEITVK